MDIGKITGSAIGSLTNEAAQSASQAADDSFARKLEAAVSGNDEKELKKACQEFESIMLNMLYKSMKATIIRSDLVKRDPGTEIFEAMQDESLMEQASKTGSFGLAESLFRQLSKKTGSGANHVDKETVQEREPVSEKNEE